MRAHYRNRLQVTSDQGETIDAGALWIEDSIVAKMVVLVDDDAHHTTQRDDNFYMVDID